MKERFLTAAVGSSASAYEATGVSERFHPLERLSIRIFADGADKAGMLKLYADPLINGLTTNPTLMKKAGVSDYEEFARQILDVVREKPISFEVFSDEPQEMRRQALKIAGWASNVYVKIPITNTRGDSMAALVRELSQEGVKVNVTAVLTLRQVRDITAALSESVPAVVSVFAGRIADTGVDPEPYMRASRCLLEQRPLAQLLWASVREVLNIFQADRCGCDIVTVPHEILAKALKMVDADLEDVSLDTVRMFSTDAAVAGFRL
jgi:transaldolase